MYISPITAIEKQWITHPECKTVADFEARSFISPNAIDFTIDTLYGEIPGRNTNHTTKVTEEGKVFPTFHKLAADDFVLRPGEMYDMMSDFYVRVPQGVVATLTIRSSFSRCGIRLSSGLYDSGFEGNIGASLVNHSRTTFTTEPHTRVAQIAFIASESAKEYLGGWNAEAGKHWTEVVK